MNNSLQIKRIMNEISEMKKNPSEMYVANPLENDLRTWHFTIRGPKDSEFEEGIYHGKIELSSEYPIKPPNLYFLTANGRFEVNTKICLNITKFHKESWNPAWTIKTMLEALINYFPIREQGFAGVGALDYPQEERKKLAILSQKSKCEKCGPLIQILPINKQKEEEKKEEEEKKNDNSNEKDYIQEEDPLKEAKDSDKLLSELKNLKETIKERKSKLNLSGPSAQDFLKKPENIIQKEESENNEYITFDNILTDVNLLQEVIKSIKFSKNPLNGIDKKNNTEEEKKMKDFPKANEEFLIPDKINNPEESEIKNIHPNINNSFDANPNNEDIEKTIEQKPEVIQAKNTLKLFDRILRVVQLIVLVAVISYIYLL